MQETITWFTGLTSPQGFLKEVNLEEFFSRPLVATNKKTQPLFTFTRFKENYRNASNVEYTSVLGFDVDVEPIPSLERIRESIQKLGCSAFVHSTMSATPSQPRWRLFIPLAKPISADAYRKSWREVEQHLLFPVGQEAKDPSRGWFVPSKCVGNVYLYEFIPGSLLSVDGQFSGSDGKSSSKPTIYSTSSVQERGTKHLKFNEISLPPTEEIHLKLIDHLKANWPPVGSRDITHMALAGALARLGFGPDYVGKVIKDLSDATGSDKGSERSAMVFRTYEKMLVDEPINGWNTLCEKLGAVAATQIHDILGWKAPRLPSLKEEKLPPRDPNHVYTYNIGDAPASDLKSVPISDIVGMLCSHPDWKHVLRWDVVGDTIVAINPPMKLQAEKYAFNNADITMIRMWLEAHGIKCTNDAAYQAIEAASRKCPWNPITEYLKSCKDSPGAIDAMVENAMRLKDKLSKTMVRKQLIAAVRRAIIEGGVKVDSVLVFKSLQGFNKTQFIETLFGKQYVKSNLSDIRSKDSVQELKGIWAVEFGELASIANSDVETLKEFLSRSIDKYRPSYGRTKIDVPRTCVFFGTTNSASFLKDETGNRRFWILEIDGKIDLDYVRLHRDEIWGEAYAAALSDETHWLEDADERAAEARTKDFIAVDAWEELVYRYCKGKKAVKVDEIYQMAICGGDLNAFKGLGERENKRISRILTMMGAKSQSVRIDGKVVRAWKVPDEIKDPDETVTDITRPAPIKSSASTPALKNLLERIRK